MSRSVARSSASTAASCSASSPSSPSSTPATWDSSTANCVVASWPALLGGGQRLAQPPELGLRRLDPAAAGGDLAREAGDALAPVGGAAQGGRHLLLGGVASASASCRAVTAASSAARDSSTSLGQLGLRRGTRSACGGQVVGVGAGRCAPARRCRAGADPVGGERRGAAQPLAQRGRGGTRPRWPRASAGAASAASRSSAASGRACRPAPLDLLATDAQGALVGDLLRRASSVSCDQVVGQQAGAGVAQVGLDDRRPRGRSRPAGRAA